MASPDVTRVRLPAGPSPARVWCALLGGKDHYECDRSAADELIEAYNDLPALVRTLRLMHEEVVSHLAAECSVTRFADLGCGFPDGPRINTHEILSEVSDDPTTVLYVDDDPVVMTHARGLHMGTADQFAHLGADIRDTSKITSHPALGAEPRAYLMCAVLEHLNDAEAASVLRRLADGSPPGSVVAVVHTSANDATRAVSARWGEVVPGSRLIPRTPERLRELLATAGLVDMKTFTPWWRDPDLWGSSKAPQEPPTLLTDESPPPGEVLASLPLVALLAQAV